MSLPLREPGAGELRQPRHLTETWEGQLLGELGKPLEQSTAP